MTHPTVGQYTYQEIMSQGQTWKKTLAGAAAQMPPILERLHQEIQEVIFTGCGSTYYLSLAAAKTWIALTGSPARGLPASELWYYPESTYTSQQPFLVAVSRSGETTETLHAIQAYEARYPQDWLTVCVYPESTMAQRAPLRLLTTNAQENSIAQTRSFSSMFVLTQLLAGYAAKNDAYLASLQQVPERFDALVQRYESLARQVGSDKRFQHFVFLGSGLQFGLASEVMLKMKEMSTSISEVFHFMEFRHGPMSMITPNSLVIGLMSDERKAEENKVLTDMQKLGATTFALCEDAKGVEADLVVELASGVPATARGALFLPILQLMAYYHSLDKGLNPDQPTNLQAVVQF